MSAHTFAENGNTFDEKGDTFAQKGNTFAEKGGIASKTVDVAIGSKTVHTSLQAIQVDRSSAPAKVIFRPDSFASQSIRLKEQPRMPPLVTSHYVRVAVP